MKHEWTFRWREDTVYNMPGRDVLSCHRCGTTAVRTRTGDMYKVNGPNGKLPYPKPVHPNCDIQAAREVMEL